MIRCRETSHRRGRCGLIRSSSIALALNLTLGLTLGLSTVAEALSLDARKMGMAGVSPPHSRRLQADNPAYRMVPERPGDLSYFNLPIPLGLIATISNPPPLDSEEEDFDPLEVFNLLANPPWHLELRDPPPLDGDIRIALGAEHLQVYWEEAQQVLHQEPFIFDYRLDRLSLGMDVRTRERSLWRVQVNPYVDLRGWSWMDDALFGVLAQGDSLKPNSLYTGEAYAKTAAAAAFKLTWARRLNEGGNTDVFLGIAPKFLLGLGMARDTFQFRADTGADYFASDSLIVEERNYARYTDGFAPGYGFGLDMGVALRQGPWDFSVGARDLGANIQFPSTTLEEQNLLKEEGSNESVSSTEVIEEGAAHHYHIKPLWTFLAAYSSDRWLVGGELRVRQENTSFHLGGEYRFSTVALRGGILRDPREQWQMSTGVGLRLGRVELNLALETHSRWIQEKRGLALGSGIQIY